MTIMTIASTAYGLHATRQNAKDQERAYRAAQATEETQLAARFGAEANQRNAMARAERARLRAQSAETGAAGLSIDDLLNNVDFQAGQDIATMGMNQTNATNASRSELGSRLAGIQQPDYIGGALNAGLQIYANQPIRGERPAAMMPPTSRTITTSNSALPRSLLIPPARPVG